MRRCASIAPVCTPGRNAIATAQRSPQRADVQQPTHWRCMGPRVCLWTVPTPALNQAGLQMALTPAMHPAALSVCLWTRSTMQSSL